MSDLVFLDLETTGLDPTKHAIWEIGMITDSGEYRWVLDLSSDEVKGSAGMALAVGNYYERALAEYKLWRGDGLTFPQHARDYEDERGGYGLVHYIPSDDRKDLAAFVAREINRSHIVGAVPSFDERFLGDFLNTYGYPPAWHYHLVDVEALAAGKLGLQPPWKSKDLYRALGVNPEAFDEHTALGDARMAKAVYEKVFDLPPSYPDAILEETYRTP